MGAVDGVHGPGAAAHDVRLAEAAAARVVGGRGHGGADLGGLHTSCGGWRLHRMDIIYVVSTIYKISSLRVQCFPPHLESGAGELGQAASGLPQHAAAGGGVGLGELPGGDLHQHVSVTTL